MPLTPLCRPYHRCCRRFRPSQTAPSRQLSPVTLALTGLHLQIRGMQIQKLKTIFLCPPTPALAASAACPAAKADPRRRSRSNPKEGVFRPLPSTSPRMPLPRDDREAMASLPTVLSLNTTKRGGHQASPGLPTGLPALTMQLLPWHQFLVTPSRPQLSAKLRGTLYW
jgi:hypothetical protein